METTFSGATLTSRHPSVSEEANTAKTIPKTANVCPEFSTTGLQSQLFQTLHNQSSLLLRDENFSAESTVDILRVSCNEGSEKTAAYPK
jgi:hypothetical protein